jgi:hypothetical protein
VTIYNVRGNPNGNLPGVNGDVAFDQNSGNPPVTPNNYFISDGGTLWIAYNASGAPSGPWIGVITTTPVASAGLVYNSVLTYDVDAMQSREPERFSAGDTLVFKKNLPTFLPSKGWSLQYILTDMAGLERCLVNSIPGSGDTNNWHLVDVDNFVPTLPEGDYILAGYAVNGAERREIYQGNFHCIANFPAGTAQAPQTTHAQRMITLLESQLETLATKLMKETDVQRNRFVQIERDKVLSQLQYYKELRRNEIQKQRARSGLPPGNVSQPLFNIG